ncbi:helix-turn-helix domain-containing protein [Carnobacterium maltaromaticum]|uniref:helix-turn-helix domain-containing protein n=1 Tax=Carnobacterium maltaromaticum TaxID=2751 RepID=UPI000C75F9D6|nr:hypothetical protein CYV32_15665 [Carnobacterium maltaromaticum]
MPRQPIRNFLALKEQGVNNIAQRLQHALGSQSVTDIANQTGLSRATINQYLNAKNLPSLDRLAVLAKATNHSLKWLLFGDIEEAKIADKYRLVVSDDVMSPHIEKRAQIEYEALPLQGNRVLGDGIYVIATAQGNVVRRLQWQESNQEYVVFGDNPIYPKQNMKQVNVIGKVTAALTPL